MIRHEEPYELRGSRTVLREGRGESPLSDSTVHHLGNSAMLRKFSIDKKEFERIDKYEIDKQADDLKTQIGEIEKGKIQ